MGRSSQPGASRRSRLRVGGRDERGVGLVEMAVAAPLLILFVMGIIEFGSAYNDKISLNQAVRDGARAGAVGEFSNGCTSGWSACIVQTADAATNVDDASFSVVTGSTMVGSEFVVCGTATVDSTTPIIAQFLDGRTLKSRIAMRIERIDDDLPPDTGTGNAPGWCTL